MQGSGGSVTPVPEDPCGCGDQVGNGSAFDVPIYENDVDGAGGVASFGHAAAHALTSGLTGRVCTADPLLEANRALHDGLTRAGVAHVYEEFPGGHEWGYWETDLADTLRFFAAEERRAT